MIRLLTGLVVAAFGASASIAAPAEADAMLAQLSKIRLDKKQIYSVRDISIRRDVLSISLNRGTVAFTEPVDGRVTGAVYIGSGDILAIPPGRVEKEQLFRFTKSALLSERFETAIFRFTDDTYDEILRQYKAHAIEEVDPESVEQILRWESELERRAAFLNDRLLADLVAETPRPIFLGQIEGAQLGWFDAIYDERRVEEVLVQQNTSVSDGPIVWTSFDRRGEESANDGTGRPFEIVSVEDDGALLRLRFRTGGDRLLSLDLPPSVHVSSVSSASGDPFLFVEGRGRLAVVLPEPAAAGAEMELHVEYSPESPPGSGIRPTLAANAVGPAVYRDQWIIDGLAAYAVANDVLLAEARAQLLEASPEGVAYESLGPVSIGFRMTQPRTTPGYVAALRNKSAWIMHMLRFVMRRGDDLTPFARLIDEIGSEFPGRTISTEQFRQLAEKHAAKELDWFFESWVFGTGIPAYSVDYSIEPAADGGFVVKGDISQSGVPNTFEMPVPLFADDVYLGDVPVSVDGGEFQFPVAVRPQRLSVDLNGVVLKMNP